MKVAIYLGNDEGNKIKVDNIFDGNPGIGGTQYCMLQLAEYLSTRVELCLVLSKREFELSRNIKFTKTNSDTEFISAINDNGCNILITQFLPSEICDRLDHVKIIVWSHNYIYADYCQRLSKSDKVFCNVFVGKQQYDRYIDNDIIKKSTYIYNMFFDEDISTVRFIDNKTVVYMGALVEGKGFSELCSIWPSIINEVPNATLLVLGSGALYGRIKLGPLGIAEESYERKIASYITDKKGIIIPSVRFLGVVGSEKTDIFRRATVGVVNPTARTETFGMGIAEMAKATLPVVTLAKNGHFDTVINDETGLLGNNLLDVRNKIVYLLKHTERNRELGLNAKKLNKRYNPNLIGQQWLSLLEKVHNSESPLCDEYIKASPPYTNNTKWLRIILRFLRFKLKLHFIPSLIDMECLALKIIKRMK